MNFTAKVLERKFVVDLGGLGPAGRAVREVLEEMERRTVEVYSPDDQDAFTEHPDADGGLSLHGRATMPVSIPEWLCVACQRIRVEHEGDTVREDDTQGFVAWYRCNAKEVLFPVDGFHQPVGPAGLDAEIVFSQDSLDYLQSSPDGFKFVVAHELAHVFDAMKYIVPAAMNWEAFWEKPLQRGFATDAARFVSSQHTLFLDDYASANELAMIEAYWPSSAGRWFEAFRRLAAEENL